MSVHKIEQFKNIGVKLFNNLVSDYGYILNEVKVNQLHGKDWSVHLIYINDEKQLRIIIKQEPYYTDYGFSFFIYKIGTDEYNILYNVPHEKQDKEDNFIIKAHEDLFSNKETLGIISGQKWSELKRIPFMK